MRQYSVASGQSRSGGMYRRFSFIWIDLLRPSRTMPLPKPSQCLLFPATCVAAVCGFCLQSDWGVVQRGYYAAVLGEAPHTFTDPVVAVRELKKDNSVSGAQQVLYELTLCCLQRPDCGQSCWQSCGECTGPCWQQRWQVLSLIASQASIACPRAALRRSICRAMGGGWRGRQAR